MPGEASSTWTLPFTVEIHGRRSPGCRPRDLLAKNYPSLGKIVRRHFDVNAVKSARACEGANDRFSTHCGHNRPLQTLEVDDYLTGMKTRIAAATTSGEAPYAHLEPIVEALLEAGNEPSPPCGGRVPNPLGFYQDKDGWRCDLPPSDRLWTDRSKIRVAAITLTESRS